MRKIITYLVLIFASALWVGGCSKGFHKTLSNWGIIDDDYRYGDLYRLSCLPQFKKKKAPFLPYLPANTPKTKVDLYSIRDSFTEPGRIDSTDLLARKYHHLHWTQEAYIELDTTVKNVLIIETVERNIRELLPKTINNFKIGKPKPVKLPLQDRVPDWIFPTAEATEDRLDRTLFSKDFFWYFKEWKALLNQKVFGKTNEKVRFSANGEHIFYYQDVDTTQQSHSSFKYLTDSELEVIVDNLNKTYLYYRGVGFDEIYFSLIPNKATILIPNEGEYNRLIERIEVHPKLLMPKISVMKFMQQNATTVFEKGDSHWTPLARNEWLKLLNEKLNGKEL